MAGGGWAGEVGEGGCGQGGAAGGGKWQDRQLQGTSRAAERNIGGPTLHSCPRLDLVASPQHP